MNTSVLEKNTLLISLFSITLLVLGYTLKVMLNIVVAKYTSPALYGDFSIATRILNVTAVIALVGTNVSSRRFLPNYLANDEVEKATNYFAWNIQFVIKSFLIYFSLSLLLLAVILTLHHLGVKHLSSYHIAIYCLWITPFTALSTLLASYLLCNKNTYLSIFLESIAQYLLLIPLFIGAALLLHNTLSETNIMLVLFLAFFILFFIDFMVSKAKLPALFKLEFIELIKKPVSANPKWAKLASKLIVNNIIFTLCNILDILLVETFDTSENHVGYYAAAITISGCIWLIPQGVFRYMQPEINNLIKNQQEHILQKKLTTSMIVCLILTLTTSVVIITFSHTLLNYFSPAYQVARPALIVLTIAYFLGSLSEASSLILAFSGHESELIKINMSQISLLLLIGSLFTYFFSFTGTACAVLVVTCIRMYFTVWTVKRNLKLKPLILF